MSFSFFFYDLETSGLDPRRDRIMQFAGQRTDMDFNCIDNPVNLLVKMSDDTLPSPQAIMVTKITPQSTLRDGLSEAEFCRYLDAEIFTPNTVAVGYNSTRFDDEFMRHLFWRNFYDPYEWQWRDGRSKWDLLDVVRLTRALRPEGITWPFTEDGKETNRLELITKLNGISHESAHDALSDVNALIDVARLIKEKQPKLFTYLFKLRDKKLLQQMINLSEPKPFVYASGRYSSEFHKTTVAFPLAPAPNGNLLVYDLRYNLEEAKDFDGYFPVVKELRYNRCPAVAPISVLSQGDGWAKLQLSPEQVKTNLRVLLSQPTFAEEMRTAYENRPEFPPAIDAESALYDGFLGDRDRSRCNAVRNASARDLADFHPEFDDPRLPELLTHYKARNFPTSLDQSEQEIWEKYRLERIQAQQESFIQDLEELAAKNADPYLLQELQLWYQSLLPYT